MSRYFYAVATLPYLSYESETFMTPQEFIEFCEYQLSPADLQEMMTVSMEPPSAPGGTNAQRGFYRFERGLRNSLVRMRAASLGVDASDFISTTRNGDDYSEDSMAAELARATFGAQSPLQGEEILDRGRWDVLTLLESGHFFDLDVLIIYYLKLMILTRKNNRSREVGTQGYEAAYAKMTESMKNTGTVGA